jgi:ribosomal protein S21
VSVKVIVGEGEPLTEAIRRFRRMVRKAGVQSGLRPRYGKKSLAFYKKPSELKREKKLVDLIRKRRNWNRYSGPSAGPFRIRAKLRQISRI